MENNMIFICFIMFIVLSFMTGFLIKECVNNQFKQFFNNGLLIYLIILVCVLLISLNYYINEEQVSQELIIGNECLQK